MEPIIEFKQVAKEFEGQVVLKELDLSIHQGEIFVLVGPSGSGKTTSLKMINGLIEPTEGNVYFKQKTSERLSTPKVTLENWLRVAANCFVSDDVRQGEY